MISQPTIKPMRIYANNSTKSHKPIDSIVVGGGNITLVIPKTQNMRAYDPQNYGKVQFKKCRKLRKKGSLISQK